MNQRFSQLVLLLFGLSWFNSQLLSVWCLYRSSTPHQQHTHHHSRHHHSHNPHHQMIMSAATTSQHHPSTSGLMSDETENGETNRVLEEFIWQKIIAAPTDPEKAYQELRSSLEAITAESSQLTTNQIKLPPESLSFSMIAPMLSPRSLRRRSSYLSPDSGGGSSSSSSSSTNAVVASSSTSATESVSNQQQQQQQSVFNHPSTSNKYIPEYGAKELYTLVAAAAGSPDKQPPLLPPPPPPIIETPARTVEELEEIPIQSQSNTIKNDVSAQPSPQDLFKEAMKKVAAKTKAAAASSSTSYSGPMNTAKHHYFPMNKMSSKHKKAGQMANVVHPSASVNAATSATLKTSETTQTQTQESAQSATTTTASGTTSQRGHQQAQSQSIYDILPMPAYGSVKQGGLTAHHNTFEDQDGSHLHQMHHMSGFGSSYIPPSPAQQHFEAKRTFEITPFVEQKQMIPDSEQHYVPAYNPAVPPPPPPIVQQQQQPLEPQIIDVMPDEQPIQIVFRSSSARVNVKQVHMPVVHQEVETTRTEEKPQRVLHQLVRPIVQEVVEIIQPYRRVTQEIRPVLEEIRTVVAKQADSSDGHSHRQHHHRQRIEQMGNTRGEKW